ncbi:hypothetical protein, unlikely [Trypanosoma brucei gambiense DAL972]|uniref:Uncharacterized protein n=1 Tax=Trypanosoma brucei gambiense (strain MHOM/CI/86/DAL972) TaxID=679716 RepID=C9ZSN6_TRYB9|nr:hypothetical protein, unlikely [Trypanosoma brucei gambiense DAL972]CBH12420.1 hypothetical protein, unlikely [Trypanosoma brucei gambiense DAL972]|eukprot:XP_011774701.1 hypothetical protein, unlikely [Trypanosoma brucei gambiense DAL972]
MWRLLSLPFPPPPPPAGAVLYELLCSLSTSLLQTGSRRGSRTGAIVVAEGAISKEEMGSFVCDATLHESGTRALSDYAHWPLQDRSPLCVSVCVCLVRN